MDSIKRRSYSYLRKQLTLIIAIIAILYVSLLCCILLYDFYKDKDNVVYLSKEKFDHTFHSINNCPALLHFGGVSDSLKVSECRRIGRVKCNACSSGYVFISERNFAKIFHSKSNCKYLKSSKHVKKVKVNDVSVIGLSYCHDCYDGTLHEIDPFTKKVLYFGGIFILLTVVLFVISDQLFVYGRPYNLKGKIYSTPQYSTSG